MAVLTGAVRSRSSESSEGSEIRLGSRLISLAGCFGFTDSCVSASQRALPRPGPVPAGADRRVKGRTAEQIKDKDVREERGGEGAVFHVSPPNLDDRNKTAAIDYKIERFFFVFFSFFLASELKVKTPAQAQAATLGGRGR